VIEAIFIKKQGYFIGFKISGHAGFADLGQDVVCASVSSAVQLTANLITENFKIDSKLKVTKNCIKFTVSESHPTANIVIESLKEHLEFISIDYPETLNLKTKWIILKH